MAPSLACGFYIDIDGLLGATHPWFSMVVAAAARLAPFLPFFISAFDGRDSVSLHGFFYVSQPASNTCDEMILPPTRQMKKTQSFGS